MNFGGWVRTSWIDAPGHVAAVLFCAGCNFRCPYCHNPDLVERNGAGKNIPEKEVMRFLVERQEFIDAVVISGGEPTLQPGLAGFLGRLRSLRRLPLWIKLDTNGSQPDTLRAVISAGLVDAAAMDVKASPARYPALGAGVDVDAIDASIRVLNASALEVEYRTTVIQGFHTAQDIQAIAGWIAPARRYALQRFNPKRTLDPAWRKCSSPLPQEMARWAELARRLVPEVIIR